MKMMETSSYNLELDPIWNDLVWAMGQLFFMGWEGTEVTPQIKTLIEDHHLAAAQQTAKLVQQLQIIAHESGHPVPLLIGLDQENGGVNSLFDEDFICQFPSAMGISATNSLEIAYDVAKATAQELSAVGVNLIMGPVLDVLTNAHCQPLGVRAAGDDPQEVSQYCIAAINGYKDAGIATCGKHFPSYGNLDLLGSSLEMPIIRETIEELSLGALVPFRNSIREGVDAMMVGGCAMVNDTMNIMHACLSDQVVEGLLRNDLGFAGVTISECLEMDSLSHDIGVRGGAVMAVGAGCDLVLFCRSFLAQQEAISGLKLGIENGMITRERITSSLKRILHLKSKCTNWDKALNPPGTSLLSKIHPSHLDLSRRAYDRSITVVRDRDHHLPLLETLKSEDELLLLTPLVNPLPASASAKVLSEKVSFIPTDHSNNFHRSSIKTGEGVFRELGRSLARLRQGKLLHTSYTANGVRPIHESLINRAAAIIIVTADANRNLYQNGFTKHVGMMCSLLNTSGRKKSPIVVSVSSPYDFALDSNIGTYICTYDFTEIAMSALVRALFGDFTPQGTLPGSLRKRHRLSKSLHSWLVELWDKERDLHQLEILIESNKKSRSSPPNFTYSGVTASSFIPLPLSNVSENVEACQYVVRNSSTQELFGFCSTQFYRATGLGVVSSLFISSSKQNLSIGHSLHQRALKDLLNKPGIKRLQLGSSIPSIFLGIPMSDLTEGGRLKSWFNKNGWENSSRKLLYILKLPSLIRWSASEELIKTTQKSSFSFGIIYGLDNASSVLEHVLKFAGPETILVYHFALQDRNGIGIAKSPIDGSLFGTVIISRLNSQLSTVCPALKTCEFTNQTGQADNKIGGILAPVVTNCPQSATVLRGLVHLAICQSKTEGNDSCILSCVENEERDVMIDMGFDILDAFEEFSCAADQIRLSN
ncbi:Beta-hexosaminidase [Golovinomyces cichoracearum]|uniref:Beta-hexosaminidase n=1 Tax=Golovinomyces cichoracearum TaxID=62708 RepID=A0A420IT90_9PEZI|nr:Beta-hexosaminidase [Golovinomyces cichoracearum]